MVAATSRPDPKPPRLDVHHAQTQTEETAAGVHSEDVAQMAKEVAEQVSLQSGFVYDPDSGYYYDSNSGLYYCMVRTTRQKFLSIVS